MLKKLIEGIFAVDKCIYLPDVKALILADLHLGFEESFEKKGILIPKFHYKDAIKNIDWILSATEVKHIILNGDIKHEFGRISQQEWREVTRFVNHLKDKGIKITAVKGNHDTIFGPLAKKLDIKEVKEFKHDNMLIVHGDYVPEKLAKIIIIGHEHPAITLRDKAKAEKFKCFVKTKYNNSTVICQPSFCPSTIGTDITKEKIMSPLLKNIKNSEIFIVNEKNHEVLDFGPVSDII